ncbi:hypothetical protein Ahy_A09g042448 [Arachis hypogaea]|uniref:Uncharacterized protein n=1 Tax=Arachis hypogaea TaxID=3818 RepID=A0A445BFV3_ARAHY|nr:hypothetical protein Ahy_A09g042448 [Arachis hypogaea]
MVLQISGTPSSSSCSSAASATMVVSDAPFTPTAPSRLTSPVSDSVTGRNASAASAAAFWMSLASVVSGTGRRHAESAKLRQADLPLRAIAATSCARAAISAVANVPSHILVFLFGSLTSQTHLPEFLRRTPR